MVFPPTSAVSWPKQGVNQHKALCLKLLHQPIRVGLKGEYRFLNGIERLAPCFGQETALVGGKTIGHNNKLVRCAHNSNQEFTFQSNL
jgi:hypothetical protein